MGMRRGGSTGLLELQLKDLTQCPVINWMRAGANHGHGSYALDVRHENARTGADGNPFKPKSRRNYGPAGWSMAPGAGMIPQVSYMGSKRLGAIDWATVMIYWRHTAMLQDRCCIRWRGYSRVKMASPGVVDGKNILQNRQARS